MSLAGSVAELNKYASGSQNMTCVPCNRQMLELCTYLYRRGWISAYHANFDDGRIDIVYKFASGANIINRFEVISRPGNRVYCSRRRLAYLCRKQNRNSHYILSTSHGLLSSHEALSRLIGGELLMQIVF